MFPVRAAAPLLGGGCRPGVVSGFMVSAGVSQLMAAGMLIGALQPLSSGFIL